jgi:uncharacterized membrane protein YdbT with pleckstrin-like domain
MPYPDSQLTEGEEIVSAFRPHWKSLVIPAVVTIGFIVGVLLAGSLLPAGVPRNVVYVVLSAGFLVFAVVPFLQWWFTIFVLTNERLIMRKGIIARAGIEIPLEVINDVIFSQTVFERLLGFGDLIIESAGERGQSRFSNIPRPSDFQSELYRVREDRARDLAGGGSRAETLQVLAELHRSGALTDEEFAAKKAELLDEL